MTNHAHSESVSGWTVNATSESFQRDVFENSTRQPVVVDFWAAGCQPCRLLAPLLEKLAQEYQGRFLLVKVNIDEVPEAALAFGVQSIPAVFAVFDQKTLDGFVGLVTEDAVRQWLQRAITEAELALAGRLEASEPERASALYQRILSEQPRTWAAVIGLARLAVSSGDWHTARQLFERLSERGYLEPEAEKIRAALQLHEKQSLDLDALRADAIQYSNDPSRQIAYAEALAAHQRHEEALELLLSIVENQQGEFRDRARQAMLDIFRVLPDDSPVVATYRRRLAAALY